jgi:5-methylcytosine-specific restriction protein B
VSELIILYGPPGTGKTYQAARRAARIIDPTLETADDKAVVAAHQAFVAAGRILWVTFHPSYSYEDFIEGFRPELGPTDTLTFVVKPGPFRLACDACRTRGDPPARLPQVGNVLGRTTRYKVIAVDGGGVVLESVVTRSDAIAGANLEYADYWTVRRFRECELYGDDLSPSGQHPEEKRRLARLTGLANTVFNSPGPRRALFEWMYPDRLTRPTGVPFPDVPSEAGTVVQPDGGRRAVLVIDEINRADLARVFGELLTVLELDKREGAPEERRIILPYSGDHFSVPRSLSVIGTMNTADRSLAVLDVALRRRFEFVELEPEPELCSANYGGLNLEGCLTRWNHRITALLSRDNRIGHSDYMEARLEALRATHKWSDDDEGRGRAVALTVRHSLLPLLLEYFHDDWRAAHIVLGNTSLLEEVPFDDVQALAGDEMDLSQSSSFRLATWSDPSSPDWDSEKFSQALNEHSA